MKDRVVCFRLLLSVAVFWLVSAVPAEAGLIVTGNNANVTAGSTATVTFAISDTSAEQLAGFQLQLQLTTTPSNAGVLQFSSLSAQPDPFGNSNYVFYGNSFDQSPPPSAFWDSVTSTVIGGPLDIATGGDLANTGSTSFPGNFILATVQVDATNAVVGDTYQIALVPANSYFQDPSGDNLSYTSTAATITIVSGVSAVPAPSSFVLVGIGGLTCLLYYWRSLRPARLQERANA